MVVGLQRASTEAQERLVSEAPLMVKGAGHGPTRLRDRGDPGDIIPPPSVMGAAAAPPTALYKGGLATFPFLTAQVRLQEHCIYC